MRLHGQCLPHHLLTDDSDEISSFIWFLRTAKKVESAFGKTMMLLIGLIQINVV